MTLQMDKYPVLCISMSSPRHVDRMNFRGKPRAAPGRSMIDAIKSVVRGRIAGIVLTALESVIGYYTRLGSAPCEVGSV